MLALLLSLEVLLQPLIEQKEHPIQEEDQNQPKMLLMKVQPLEVVVVVVVEKEVVAFVLRLQMDHSI